jgi:hypothetical protein
MGGNQKLLVLISRFLFIKKERMGIFHRFISEREKCRMTRMEWIILAGMVDL